MSAMSAQPSKHPSACYREAQHIKSQLDTLLSKMYKQAQFTPTRNQLEEIAELLIDLINKYHSEVKGNDAHLKAAVIDLTEVPEMAPQMQRIAFLTAMKDASKEIERFLATY